MESFYDTHAHLDYPDFSNDLPELIHRAANAGITRIISIGTDLESSARAIALAERFRQVYAVAGWHPSYAAQAPDDVRPQLRELAKHPRVVALGETGLDYSRLPSRQPETPTVDDEPIKRKQRQLFEQHLEVAAEAGLNCVVHQRDAFDDVLDMMQAWSRRVRGVFHCFVGETALMQRVIRMGSLVSFTGILTFKNAQVVRDTLAATPLNAFMLETDCPYLAPVPYRGKRCEPAYVNEIAKTAATVKQCSLEELSRMTCATAKEFFRMTNDE